MLNTRSLPHENGYADSPQFELAEALLGVSPPLELTHTGSSGLPLTRTVPASLA